MTGKEYIISEFEKIEKNEETRFVKRRCPHEFGLKDIESCDGPVCQKCWKQALKSEVK